MGRVISRDPLGSGFRYRPQVPARFGHVFAAPRLGRPPGCDRGPNDGAAAIRVSRRTLWHNVVESKGGRSARHSGRWPGMRSCWGGGLEGWGSRSRRPGRSEDVFELALGDLPHAVGRGPGW